MNLKSLFRSAVSGRFVSRKDAQANPRESVRESILPALKSVEPLAVGDTVVLEVPGAIHSEQRAYLQTYASNAFPGKRVLILSDGIRVSRDEQLDRMEKKIDRLLEAVGYGL